MLAGLLGAAVGVPYVVDQSETWREGFAPSGSQSTADGGAAPSASTFAVPAMPSMASPGDHLYASPAPLEGIQSPSLAEVLRLDVSKDWVYSRWARKSTGLAEPDLFGIRVPLVSGTRMTDIAGSLTYYFNKFGQVEKIRLVGKTADTSELVNLMCGRYGFQPATPLLAGEQLYRVERSGRVESELVTRPESVLWSTSPHGSFAVQLEINRPGSDRYVVHPPPKLPVGNRPASPAPLLGDEQPVGKPVLPGEMLVPSSDGVPAQQVSTAKESVEAAVPKKSPKSHLRWPN